MVIILVILFGLILINLIKAPINNFINSVFNPLDKSCNSDRDCVVKRIDCSYFHANSRGEAVNIGYEPFCPLPYFGRGGPWARPQWEKFEARCSENGCVSMICIGGDCIPV